MKNLLLCLIGGVLVIVSVLFIGNTRAYALDENKCLVCHGNPQLSKTSGNGQKISLYVNEEAVNIAAHRFIDCTTCHPENATFPHKAVTPLTKQSLAEKCGTCHKYEYKLHFKRRSWGYLQ